MAQPYTTGPVDIWVGIATSPVTDANLRTTFTPAFLGHCEDGVDLSFRPQYSNLGCDLGGSVPFDVAYEGTEARVAGALTRWNDSTYQFIHDYTSVISRATIGTISPGADAPGEIGTLMVTEGAAYPLWLRFPASTKVAYGLAPSGAQPAGLRFVAALLVEDSWGRLGTKPRRIPIAWRCLRVFTPTTITSLGSGGFTLYDFNMTGLGFID